MYIYNLYVSWYLIYKLGPILRANLLVKRLDSTQLITPVTVGLMLAMLMIQMVILHLRFQLHSNFLNPTKTHIHIRSEARKKWFFSFRSFLLKLKMWQLLHCSIHLTSFLQPFPSGSWWWIRAATAKLATKEQKPSRAMALVNGFKYRHTSHVWFYEIKVISVIPI